MDLCLSSDIDTGRRFIYDKYLRVRGQPFSDYYLLCVSPRQVFDIHLRQPWPDVQLLHILIYKLVFLLLVKKAHLTGYLIQNRGSQVGPHALLNDYALGQTVLRKICEPFLYGTLRIADLRLHPVQEQFSCIRSRNAKHALKQLAPSGTYKTGKSHYFPFVKCKIYVRKVSFFGIPFQFHELIMAVHWLLFLYLIDFSAYHMDDQLVLRHLFRPEGPDIVSVPENADPVRYTEYLFKFVADIQDGNVLFSQHFNNIIKLIYLTA